MARGSRGEFGHTGTSRPSRARRGNGVHRPRRGEDDTARRTGADRNRTRRHKFPSRQTRPTRFRRRRPRRPASCTRRLDRPASWHHRPLRVARGRRSSASCGRHRTRHILRRDIRARSGASRSRARRRASVHTSGATLSRRGGRACRVSRRGRRSTGPRASASGNGTARSGPRGTGDTDRGDTRANTGVGTLSGEVSRTFCRTNGGQQAGEVAGR